MNIQICYFLNKDVECRFQTMCKYIVLEYILLLQLFYFTLTFQYFLPCMIIEVADLFIIAVQNKIKFNIKDYRATNIEQLTLFITIT